VDQVTLLMKEVEDSFSTKKDAGVVFVDLTAVYDTVWHRGLASYCDFPLTGKWSA